jgi:hypothetical protein
MKAHLDGTVDVAASVFEDVLERLAARLGLVGDATSDKIALSICGDLTRDPDLASGFNGLGLKCCQRYHCDGKSHAREYRYEEHPDEDLRSVPRLQSYCQEAVS